MKTDPILLPQGKIIGHSHNGYDTFLGIPYAKPPVNERRWRAPEPVDENPKAEILAFDFGPAPMQMDMSQDPFYGREFYDDSSFMPAQSEDCLYLNIWRPSHMEDPCPVAIWIHGGAFDHGFSSEKEFDGEAFARNGVILVTIGYRVGPFGFLYDEQRAKEDGHSGIYGLLDQAEAIGWVKRNIAAFGGNPSRITLIGQSAGAFSIQNQLSLQKDPNLFHQVILQSGCGTPQGMSLTRSSQEAAATSLDLKNRLQVSSMQEMEQLPAKAILEASIEQIRSSDSLLYAPAADGRHLPEEFAWNMPDMPKLIGATCDDLFKTDRDNPLLCEAKAMAAAFHPEQSYVYEFAHSLPGDDAGAFHSSELWYTFHTLHRCWRPFEKQDDELASRMIRHWTQFIKSGSPDLPDHPWKSFDTGEIHRFE